MGWVKYFYYRKQILWAWAQHMMWWACDVCRLCTMLMFSSYVFFLVSCHSGIHIRHYLSSSLDQQPKVQNVLYWLKVKTYFSQKKFWLPIRFFSVKNREKFFLKTDFNKVDNCFPKFFWDFCKDPITINSKWKKQKLQFISNCYTV